MVVQKQNENLRYTKSWNIFIIGILALVLVIWFGILIQKSENDILLLSRQIQSEANQIRQKSHVRVQRNTVKDNATSNTGLQLGTGTTSSTGNK